MGHVPWAYFQSAVIGFALYGGNRPGVLPTGSGLTWGYSRVQAYRSGNEFLNHAVK